MPLNGSEHPPILIESNEVAAWQGSDLRLVLTCAGIPENEQGNAPVKRSADLLRRCFLFLIGKANANFVLQS